MLADLTKKRKVPSANHWVANRTFSILIFHHPYCNINMNCALSFYFAILFSAI